MKWTIRLGDLKPVHLAQAGAKALALGQMLRAGLPVPPGFVITVAAFRAAVRLSPQARSPAQVRAAPGQPAGAESGWETPVREETTPNALAGAVIPPGLERAVLRALEEWPEVRLWAVRSSATAEDLPKSSFAGQHESFLNVPRGEVLDRVRGCWASLFSRRAVAYRRCNGLEREPGGMAVIVQEMIPAETAGVLFTADPVSGAPDRLVLECAAGLGDRVVSGRLVPDRFVLSKLPVKILERTPGGARGMVLDDSTVLRLARLSLRVERVLGGPLDVEWAVCREQIHLLQARPVTTQPAARRWEDRQVWTNLNTGEIAPDVATPITWSLFQKLSEPLLRSFFGLFGADVSQSPAIGLVAGRIYFNANVGFAAFKPFFFLVSGIPDFAQALGGGEAEDYRSFYLPPEDLPDLGFRWPKYILSWPRLFLMLMRYSPRRGDAWTARLKSQVVNLPAEELEKMPTPQLVGIFRHMLGKGFQGWDLLYLGTQAVALPLFQKACRDWLDDPRLTLGYRLFAGLGGLPEVEAGLALWRLAMLAHADAETGAAVRSGAGWSQVESALRRTEHGRQFLAAWAAFMAEHGHHCRGELELFNARWSELPDYILGLVRGYLASVGRIDPPENQRRLALERQRLTEQCRRRLRNPVKRWLFSRALGRAQRLAVNREEWKNHAVRQLAVWRRVVLQLGRRLHRQGTLEKPDDIFFLQVHEVEAVTAGKADFNANELIHARRKEYEANLALSPPPIVVGKFTAGTAPPAPENDSNVLKGIAVSPGVVTGRAKVVLHTDDHVQVLPGEILVAPFTDPAWTLYFIPAAGVVTDQGGILSHGSIVAREYGLPAVTNVGSACRLLHTGDLVQVDGDRGLVTVLQRGPA